MSVAPRIQAHLNRMGVTYQLVSHPHTATSIDSARTAHVPSRQLAKAVMTHDGDNYRLCVVPASHRLVLNWLNKHMHGQFRLVDEEELSLMFDDCEPGAVPALGQVYGLPVVWDQSLLAMDDIYFESGDHRNLIHLDHGAFMQLMGLQDHAVISCPIEELKNESHLVH
ncbi:MAG: YbaK/EbsC family protein [Oleiphilaceae bacterium]|nr:YbaK/EbsC family protein [Oleiphilaceae bacterium]